jgi:hypothetical protein
MQQQNRIAFFMIPETVAATKTLSSTAKLLLAQLLDHRNKRTAQCNPKQATLARELGISEDTVQRKLVELRRLGFVATKRHPYGCTYEIQIPQIRGRETANPRVRNRKTADLGSPYPLFLEPDLKNLVAAAAATPAKAAAAAAPVVGVRNPESPAQKLVMELISQHPEPGNLQKAVAEIEKLLAARPGAETVEILRRNHAIWRAHWATYAPGRFIPQLWRWVRDGDWQFPPAERKGALPQESWIARRERERKESDEQFYRDLAEAGEWDVIRQYGGEPAVEVWREKLKAEAA